MIRVAIQLLFSEARLVSARWINGTIILAIISFISLQQSTLFFSMMSRTYNMVTNASDVDVWVSASTPIDLEYALLSISGVEYTSPLYQIQLNDTRSFSITGIDQETLLGLPTKITEGQPHFLRMEDTLFVDQKAKSIDVGSHLMLKKKPCLVVGKCKAVREVGQEPSLFMANTTFSTLFPDQKPTYFLIKGANGVNHKRLAKRITQQTGCPAYIPSEFIRMTMGEYVSKSGFSKGFAIVMGCCFILGLALAGQLLYRNCLENIQTYAIIEAMGGGVQTIILMAISQSALLALMGFSLGAITLLLGYAIFHPSTLSLSIYPMLIGINALFILLISVIVNLLGLYSMRREEVGILMKG
ncbi:MAG: hypothetical protein S4CHLAM102_13000 [Chlamydiia bacterium]|nr:hypothetical protein [Chlamydiia bacterium]